MEYSVACRTTEVGLRYTVLSEKSQKQDEIDNTVLAIYVSSKYMHVKELHVKNLYM